MSFILSGSTIFICLLLLAVCAGEVKELACFFVGWRPIVSAMIVGE